ncbi:hypothetical protein [Streptomyces sp. NPDC002520]
MTGDNDQKHSEEVIITATDVLGTGFRADSGTRTPEQRLLAEATLPVVIQALYADKLRLHGITGEGDRRAFALSDERGRSLPLRLEIAADGGHDGSRPGHDRQPPVRRGPPPVHPQALHRATRKPPRTGHPHPVTAAPPAAPTSAGSRRRRPRTLTGPEHRLRLGSPTR